MIVKMFAITMVFCFMITEFAFAQHHRWSVAFKSAFFGTPTASTNAITTINTPVSLGLQLRYFFRQDMALQYSLENLSGKSNSLSGNETNVQSSLSLVSYPIKMGWFSPYFIQGASWRQRYNDGRINNQNQFSYQLGVGADLLFGGNWFSTVDAQMFTDGWHYQGWSASLSFGFLF